MSSPATALKLENVLYEKKGPIAYVTINRPKVLNALNAKTIFELRSARIIDYESWGQRRAAAQLISSMPPISRWFQSVAVAMQ